MSAYERLSRYEQWMVRSNLQTIREEGVTVEEQAARLRANGYDQIAGAVEELGHTTARIHTLKLTEPESAVVRLALRLLATDAMQDWLDHERDIDPDHWSELAADLYRAIWGERPGSFTMADIKAEMESGTILT